MLKRTKIILAIALVMIIIGGLLANLIQTDFGKVKIKDVRFTGSNGLTISALLYIPKTATAKTPAPGILAIHGYINTRETQDGFRDHQVRVRRPRHGQGSGDKRGSGSISLGPRREPDDQGQEGALFP